MASRIRALKQAGGAVPSWVYNDAGFLELEQERIFASRWVCVGRADTLREAGDYLVTAIAGEPVIVVRNSEDSIQAFSNVCRHRMSLLLEGRGSVSRIVCPYHSWTYDLDGRLRGAPLMEGNEGFRSDAICLPRVRCESWQGWLFLSLDETIPAPAETFAEVADLVNDWGMAHYVESFREEMEWHGNWKQVAENFMESYHLPVCHSGTVGRAVNLRQLATSELRDDFNYHCIVSDGSNPLTIAHATNQRLSGEQRRTTWVLALYPSLMITLTPGYFWYLCIQPLGVSRSHVVFGGGMAPEFAADNRAEALFADTKAVTAAIIEEDRLCVQRVCRGAQARLAEAGPLNQLEKGNQGFARWILERVSS
jgi:phenylpropionate dioxygenase-like ring-hydroxylating dioxygenase large terminal subunit